MSRHAITAMPAYSTAALAATELLAGGYGKPPGAVAAVPAAAGTMSGRTAWVVASKGVGQWGRQRTWVE
jgi:hypothetical protein